MFSRLWVREGTMRSATGKAHGVMVRARSEVREPVRVIGHWTLPLITVLVILLAGLSAEVASGAKPRAVKIASFEQAIEVKFAPGYRDLAFVAERTGRISAVRKGRKLKAPVLDLSRQLTSKGAEQGLLSLAFPGDFRKSGLFYVLFTDPQGDLMVKQFRTRSEIEAIASSGRKIIEIPHRQGGSHNRGQLHFLGRTLYFGTGDGGGVGDPEGNAQNPDSLLGKMLAIIPTASGPERYRIPASNPFVGLPGRDEIFALGLRNPFRWSFDLRRPERPMIAIGDVGQFSWEEVNLLPLSQARGANFGWNSWEGLAPYAGSAIAGTTFPELALPHPTYCAIIGGVVARDPDLPSIRGRYLFGDFCRSVIDSVPAKVGSDEGSRSIGTGTAYVSSIAEGPGRDIYFTALRRGLYVLR